MNKKLITILLLLCILLTACNNEFAKKEYNSEEKIAEVEDRYGKGNSVFDTIDGGYSLTVSEFDGRETLWTDIIHESKTTEIRVSLSLSKGKAKVVHIDEDGNVSTIIECTPETSTDDLITQNISFKEGKNRIKVVGYECQDLALEILFEEAA